MIYSYYTKKLLNFFGKNPLKCKRLVFMDVLLNKNRVYLDYNATTPPLALLSEQWTSWLPVWGNPSSVHQDGQPAKNLLLSSKNYLSNFLGCNPLELVACSGGSEANNHAIRGLYEKYFLQNPDRNEIIVSEVEHPSVLAPLSALKSKGMIIKTLPVSREGELDLSSYQSLLSDKTFLVAVMYANNETGHIFPIHKMVKMAHKVGAFFHCDTVQAMGKMAFNLHNLEVDTASFSAHKFYALKGTGLLYCRKGILPENLIYGGSQERKRRAGTENVLGIACFGAVAQRGPEILDAVQCIKSLREDMENNILKQIPSVHIVGRKGKRLPNTSCLLISGIQSETLLMNMDLKGYSFSVGSACHSGSLNPSGVLVAMGFSEEEARSAVRISLGLGVSKEQIVQFVSDLRDSVQKIRSFS